MAPPSLVQLLACLAAGCCVFAAVEAKNIDNPLPGHCNWASLSSLESRIRDVCPLLISYSGHDDDGETVRSSSSPRHRRRHKGLAWSPWTHPLNCTASNPPYCVFTYAAAFSGPHGGGVSIVTSQPAISDSAGLLADALAGPRDPRADDADPPYAVDDVPGKGKGVVARRLIRKGEVLMVDYVAVLGDVEFPGRVKRRDGQDLMRSAVAQLPDATRNLVLGLSRRYAAGTSVEEDVLWTNTFMQEVGGVKYMALFPQISRINHACNPSAFTKFSENTLSNRVIAFRDIQPGEEVTISYSEFGMTYEERQKLLLRRWGFKCNCELCSGSKEEIAASDWRRNRLTSIRDEVVKLITAGDFQTAIQRYEEVMDLVEKERLVEHLGDHYEVMARLYMAMQKRGSAKKYAKLAISAMLQFGGTEVQAKVEELSSFVAALGGS